MTSAGSIPALEAIARIGGPLIAAEANCSRGRTQDLAFVVSERRAARVSGAMRKVYINSC